MKDFVETWVCANFRFGHVEIKVDDLLFGFWGDMTADGRIDTTSSAARKFPVLPGYLTPLNEEELADEFNRLYVAEKRRRSMPPRKHKKLDRPGFYVYAIPVSTVNKIGLEALLKYLTKNSPDYHILSEGSAKNCVTISVEVLKASGILDEQFTIRRLRPYPKEFLEEMKKFKERNPGVEDKGIRYLKPPSFEEEES